MVPWDWSVYDDPEYSNNQKKSQDDYCQRKIDTYNTWKILALEQEKDEIVHWIDEKLSHASSGNYTFKEGGYECIRSGNIPLVEWLLDNNFDITNSCDGLYGVSGFLKAIKSNDLAMVKFLLSWDASLVFSSDNDNNGSLACALECGDLNDSLEMMKTLLAHGAPINERSTDRYTPLDICCEYDLFERLVFLVENGAELLPEIFEPPLFVAAKVGNLRIVKYLWEKMNIKDPDDYKYRGKTIQEVLKENEYLESFQSLMKPPKKAEREIEEQEKLLEVILPPTKKLKIPGTTKEIKKQV